MATALSWYDTHPVLPSDAGALPHAWQIYTPTVRRGNQVGGYNTVLRFTSIRRSANHEGSCRRATGFLNNHMELMAVVAGLSAQAPVLHHVGILRLAVRGERLQPALG